MDEEKCILEIVDGVLTLVPRDKSASNSDKHESEEQRKNSIDYQTSNNYGKRQKKRKCLMLFLSKIQV
jgi:Zn-finger nucleic acid-binding protein